ncbi:MAG: hypothetical protein IV108_13365 [Burkholderiales bacterium]|nr:hypothetical protein [Burkholderiales bacterium]
MPGEVGEHLFEQGSAKRNVRVAQPPGMASNAGNPKGGKGGVFFLGYFLLDKQKKVTDPSGHDRPQNKMREAHNKEMPVSNYVNLLTMFLRCTSA